jgi:hypothetical protein
MVPFSFNPKFLKSYKEEEQEIKTSFKKLRKDYLQQLEQGFYDFYEMYVHLKVPPFISIDPFSKVLKVLNDSKSAWINERYDTFLIKPVKGKENDCLRSIIEEVCGSWSGSRFDANMYSTKDDSKSGDTK